MAEGSLAAPPVLPADKRLALPDGLIVEVQRPPVPTMKDYGNPGTHKVELPNVTAKSVGRVAASPVWGDDRNGGMTAVLLYADNISGEWVVVATTFRCEDLSARGNPRLLFLPGRPATVYFEYRLRGQDWIEVPVSMSSIGQRSNLPVLRHRDFTRAPPRRDEVIVENVKSNCTPVTTTKVTWESQDRALAALDRAKANAKDRQRVLETLIGIRLVYSHKFPGAPVPDTDPKSLQIVKGVLAAPHETGVTEDGQVIYDRMDSYENDDELLRRAYAARLNAAGLGKYAN